MENENVLRVGIFGTDHDQPNIKKIVTIQPPQNQLANIDFDVIGTSDYQLMEK